ncbi:MAG: thiamine ABC transporter substrate-binding protein [Bdellovibrionales bacterium]|nr:thiamine ABC transporter substrate-binding protein [Bdellovibrionales bacterium]
MRSRLTLFLIAAVSLVFGLLVARTMVDSRDLPREMFIEKKLRVLTYGTFVGPTGPGGEILKRFEKDKNIKIEVVSSADAGLLLERLKLTQAGNPVDVVIGLDQLLIEEAQQKFEWQPIVADKSKWHKAAAQASSDHFVAFDWSPLTFVYRKSAAEVPKTFDDLTAPAYPKQFALQDPRTSTPGIQFFHWVKALKGAGTLTWLEKFKPNVNSVSPTWAFSYGLFKKEQTRFVFSYLTSLAFHWGDEKNRDFDVLSFPQGHPVQVELAAIPKDCRECELAQDLVRSLHEEWAQRLIMTKNYMFPVIEGLEKGSIFAELPQLKTISTETGKNLSEWDKVFPR